EGADGQPVSICAEGLRPVLRDHRHRPPGRRKGTVGRFSSQGTAPGRDHPEPDGPSGRGARVYGLRTEGRPGHHGAHRSSALGRDRRGARDGGVSPDRAPAQRDDVRRGCHFRQRRPDGVRPRIAHRAPARPAIGRRGDRGAVQKLSVTDGLTGLYNRRRLMETLDVEAERSERGAGPFSVLMVDVDHFKKYNDTHGHQAGDAVLTRVAGILKEITRQVDCAARYGGEEFLVLLPQTPVDGAAEVAERLRSQLKASGANGGGDAVTVSVGVAEFPKNGDTTQSVIAAADAALYRAKADGRDRVVRSAVSAKPTRTSGANARRRRDG